MPIQGIHQPELIRITPELRLRKFDGIFDFAFEWYQDPEMVYLFDGVKEPYTREKLEKMYRYLDNAGELYFIEALLDGRFAPIGDVTFWQEDMPIFIGDPAFRGKGIGRQVISALAERGRELGYEFLYVDQIYHYNTASQKCFEGAGFERYQTTEKGVSMILKLREDVK